MFELKTAITILEILVSALIAMLLGDYLGYKVGRWKLAGILGGIAVASFIIFGIYAAVVLNK
ncbi:MAG: hypothetical protein HY665_02370 [Chloroflexi bacterium]|nr:hypothetical protein [Chloroflexota bacterium]